MTNEQLDQLSINTIRTLSMDAVQEAMSSHPGTPIARAPLIYTLWNRVMRFDPQDRELVYLAVSECNGCNYCVSAHTMVATKQTGLSESGALAARRFHSTDKKRAALLESIRKVIATKGFVSTEDVAAAVAIIARPKQ